MSNCQNPLKTTTIHVSNPKVRSNSAFVVFNMSEGIRCINDQSLKTLQYLLRTIKTKINIELNAIVKNNKVENQKNLNI